MFTTLLQPNSEATQGFSWEVTVVQFSGDLGEGPGWPGDPGTPLILGEKRRND